MATVSLSAREIALAALEQLGEATPKAVQSWFEETYGEKLPQDPSSLRQAMTKLAAKGRIHKVPFEHGLYRNGPPPEDTRTELGALPEPDLIGEPRARYRARTTILEIENPVSGAVIATVEITTRQVGEPLRLAVSTPNHSPNFDVEDGLSE